MAVRQTTAPTHNTMQTTSGNAGSSFDIKRPVSEWVCNELTGLVNTIKYLLDTRHAIHLWSEVEDRYTKISVSVSNMVISSYFSVSLYIDDNKVTIKSGGFSTARRTEGMLRSLEVTGCSLEIEFCHPDFIDMIKSEVKSRLLRMLVNYGYSIR